MIGEAFQLTHKSLNEIFAGRNTTLTFAQIKERRQSMPCHEVSRLYAQKECKNEFDKPDHSRLARLFNDGGLEYDNCRNKLSFSKQFELKDHLDKLLEHKEKYMKENITLDQYIVELAKVEQLMTPSTSKPPVVKPDVVKAEFELNETEKPMTKAERKKAQRIPINKRSYDKNKDKAKAYQKAKYAATKKEKRLCCCGWTQKRACYLIVSNKQSYKKHLNNQIHQLFKQKLYALYSLRLMNDWTMKRAIKYMNHQEAICHYQRDDAILLKYEKTINTSKLRKGVDMMEIYTIEHRRVMLRGVFQDVLKRGEYLNNHSK